MSHAAAQDTAESPITDQQAEYLAGIANDIMAGRTDFAAVVGLKPEHLEAIYALGRGLYEGGKYDEAEQAFRFLTMHRHLDGRFWMGLGASQQMQKKMQQAVQSYGMGALVAPTDPQLSLRAGECFLALGQKDGARTALEAAIMAAADSPAKQPYARRAQMILKNLGGEAATS